jgi:dTDP-4-dehydrorhamnose reductase
MRIALTGANGQLGQALCKRLAPQHDIVPLNQGEFELDSPGAVQQVIATRAQLVIHPAAYTNVDGCARDPDLAYRVNGLGTKYVALACQHLDVPLVYISTNEVFAGTRAAAYTEYDQPGPINAYGQSKWAGEQAVRELLSRFYIVRVAWLFGGEHNFVRTILRIASDPPADGLRVVDDEIGNPTYAPDVADAIARLVEQPQPQPQPFYGTYHFVNAGACSRYEFAREILRQGGYSDVPITPIRLADYQRASTPPPSTALANIAGAALDIVLRPWQEALAAYVATMKADS